MDIVLLLKFIAAFVFVISLMLLLPHALRRIGVAGTQMVKNGKRRLKVVEFMPIDHRRRLVLVRRDDKDHLILLGINGETLVEAGIPVVEDNVIEFLKEQKHAEK